MDNPRHSKALTCVQRGIFDELKSFRDLEARIGALATAQERGDAFEVFAEAYLATVAVEKAKQVWPGAGVPPSLRQRLALTIGDNGVDGIFETPLGEFHAYQAKFRTGRPSLTWDELSTFIGLADRVDQRVLVTNCDRFAGLLKERTAFYAITGNDLDKLEPQDFVTLRAWLAGAQVTRTRKTPLPHQSEAIDHILAALREHDRATALMACGTGKTLVALWVAEQIVGRFCETPGWEASDPSASLRAGSDALQPASANILVLVPSLALLGQTLHEWSRETSWPALAHLCVCSDPAVQAGSDDIILRSSDLDFPVKTDSANVREFLAARYSGVKLVFSTYQSAHVVAEGMKPGEAFDLAIFDEAHKTAGREGVHFGFALSDKNLAIKKRLFLTATPRHYDLRKRDKEGDARLVYSMDAPEIYGPVAHQLTFAEAARRGLICHYRVIISVVTTDMVNDHLLRHGEVLVQGDAVQARHVASQLALQAAVAEHGVGKIFTFHRSVASAASFVGHAPHLPGNRGLAHLPLGGCPTTAESIANHLPDFGCFHVNGTMPMSERNGIMREFRAASRAVISNARCLTEGVDVPAVDMVAFLTPKRSRVDIVQATGRAMRKAAGKTTGYVLVPLFVEQAKGETIDEALARTEFDEVWNVLQAMQEQDETLAEIIRQMREERGRTKGFDDTRFRERVEFLGPQISLEALRDSITTACVEVLGDNWDERFGELQAFKKQHGHCNVPSNYPKNQAFATWVLLQRSRCASLSDERRKRLEAIGFIWDARDENWEDMFAALKVYKGRHGRCNVPNNWPENLKLANWVVHQRQFWNQHQLTAARIARLQEIGFVLDPSADTWETRFAELENYYRLKGDCDVPSAWPENPKLATWVNNQRHRKESLTENQLSRLKKCHFVWDVYEHNWQMGLAQLREYKVKNGDCNVPDKWPENPQLSHFVTVQRQSKKKNKLKDDRIRVLDDLGFVWDGKVALWEKRYDELCEYKATHRDCNVPNVFPENPPLGSWVNTQRRFRRSDMLSEERIRRLNELDFDWKPVDTYVKSRSDAAWEIKFQELCAFRNQYGHCNVPRPFADNPSLARWVESQRCKIRARTLPDQRVRPLAAIGFHCETSTDNSGNDG